jgi:glycosyltransferase
MMRRLIRNRIGGAYNIEKVKAGWLPLASHGIFKKSIIDTHGVYILTSRLLQTPELLHATCINIRLRWCVFELLHCKKMRMNGGLPPMLWPEVLQEDYKIYKYHGLAAPRGGSKIIALRYLIH